MLYTLECLSGVMWKTFEIEESILMILWPTMSNINIKSSMQSLKICLQRFFYTVCAKIYSTLTPCNRSGIKKILPDSEFFEFEKSWQWITCATFTWHYYIHELSKEGGRKLGKKKTVSGGKESKLKI